jgi:hypothetical protein
MIIPRGGPQGNDGRPRSSLPCKPFPQEWLSLPTRTALGPGSGLLDAGLSPLVGHDNYFVGQLPVRSGSESATILSANYGLIGSLQRRRWGWSRSPDPQDAARRDFSTQELAPLARPKRPTAGIAGPTLDLKRACSPVDGIRCQRETDGSGLRRCCQQLRNRAMTNWLRFPSGHRSRAEMPAAKTRLRPSV